MSSDWVILKFLFLNSQIFFSWLLHSAGHWCSLLHFAFHSLYSSAPKFLFGSFFKWFISLLNFSFYSCIIFLILLNCLSVFSCSSLSFLKTAILSSLSGKLQISMSLRSVTRRLLWSFGSVMFPWFITFLGVSHFCLHTCSSGHLLQFSLTDFGREIPTISPARDSEAFSDHLWIHLHHASCSLLWQNS